MASSTQTYLSPDQALATLKEYESGDGLSLRELMDTRRNGQGGLTYNDFLILPGKIDFPVSPQVAKQRDSEADLDMFVAITLPWNVFFNP